MIFNKLTMSGQFGAMYKWKEVIEHQRQKEDEEKNFAFLSKQEQGAKLFKQREVEAKQQRAKEMIQKMINGCLATTLIAWKQHTVTSKKEKAMLKKFAKRMMLRVVVSSMAQWQEYCRVRKWLRNLMVRFVLGKSKRMLQQAVSVWAKYCSKMREMEAVHGTEGLHTMLDDMQNKIEELMAQNSLLVSQLGENKMKANERAQKSMNRFIQQWTNKALTNTMRGWKVYVGEAWRG